MAQAIFTVQSPKPFERYSTINARYEADQNGLIANVPRNDLGQLIDMGCLPAPPNLRVMVPLSAAQLKTPHATPTTIIPAPGPGKVIIIVGGAELETKFGTVAFDNQNAGLFYSGTVDTFSGITGLTSYQGGSSGLQYMPIDGGTASFVLADITDQAVIFSGAISGGDGTMGDGTGQLTVVYYIRDVLA